MLNAWLFITLIVIILSELQSSSLAQTKVDVPQSLEKPKVSTLWWWAGIHHSWGAGTIKWFTCLLEKQLGRVWEKIIFQPVTIVSSVLSYWDQNRIDLLLSAFSAAPNGSFAMLHYAYWCVMNRSEARWLNKHIRSHLMSADSGGAESRSPRALSLYHPHLITLHPSTP